MIQQNECIGIYLRLSLEDQQTSPHPAESLSIGNQRALILDYITRQDDLKDKRVVEFCDDGWSGTNFERPDIKKLLWAAESGQISCIIVKDLSRFGRNYLEVGRYLTMDFLKWNIRFIAINDGIDSFVAESVDSIETAFRTMIYHAYSLDLSQKVRSALLIRAKQGQFLGAFAPYGYRKDPENVHHLLPDPEAAEVVRHIFHLAAEGRTANEIAALLNQEQEPTPMLYKMQHGCTRTSWSSLDGKNFWTRYQVVAILRDERYLGKTVFRKRIRPVLGDNRRIKQSREDWIVVDNTHEAIVTPHEFDKAQGVMKKYKEKKVVRKRNFLSRKIYCGVCGHAMRLRKAGYYCGFRNENGLQCPEEVIPYQELVKMLYQELESLIQKQQKERTSQEANIALGFGDIVLAREATLEAALKRVELYPEKEIHLFWNHADGFSVIQL